jgi:hypothetical protein
MQRIVIAVLGVRVAYGLGLVVAPARVTRSWLGPVSDEGGTQVAVRALGAREVVLHGLAIAAAVDGRPLRPWLAASIAGDLTDIAATTAARADVPEGAATKTAAVAGGSAVLSAALAAFVDA